MSYLREDFLLNEQFDSSFPKKEGLLRRMGRFLRSINMWYATRRK